MFDQLFFRSDALTRQLSAPLVDERRQYLAQCLAQGMSKCTLRMKARLLLSIAEYLRLAERPNDTISLPEIKKAASRWSFGRRPRKTAKPSRRRPNLCALGVIRERPLRSPWIAATGTISELLSLRNGRSNSTYITSKHPRLSGAWTEHPAVRTRPPLPLLERAQSVLHQR
jgi:hypothetical protein